MDKLAAISNKRAQINEIVINHIRRYAALNDALDDLIRVPGEEMAAGVDSVFNAIASDLSQLQNSITTLANMLVNDEVEEIDGIEEENGIRLL